MNKHYVTATSIDPRYKNNFFKEIAAKEKAKAWLLELLMEVCGGQPRCPAQDEDPSSSENPCEAGPSANKSKQDESDDLFRACFNEITSVHQAKVAANPDMQQGENTAGYRIEAAEEVDRFMALLPLLARTANPLEWWGKATGFPHLTYASLLGNCCVRLLRPYFPKECIQSMATFLRRNGADSFPEKERNYSSSITMQGSSEF